MSIQPVGYVAYPQANVQPKKSHAGAIALGTGASAAIGATYGYFSGGAILKNNIDKFKAYVADENLLKSAMEKKHIKMGSTKEAFEEYWTKNKQVSIDKTKATLDRLIKSSKSLKRSAAICIAGVTGIIGFLTAKLAANRADNIGKVDKVKDSSTVSQVVTTQSGYQLAVPITYGATTKVKALGNGTYQVMTKPTQPKAKWDVENLSEQQLLEKYSNWIIKI